MQKHSTSTIFRFLPKWVTRLCAISVLLISAVGCTTPEIRVTDGNVRVGSFTGEPLSLCEGAGIKFRCIQGDVKVEGDAEVRNKHISFRSTTIEQIDLDSAVTIYFKMTTQPVNKQCPMIAGTTNMKAVDVTLARAEGEDYVFEIPLYTFTEIVWQDDDFEWDKN